MGLFAESLCFLRVELKTSCEHVTFHYLFKYTHGANVPHLLQISDDFRARYQVVGKLGFGATSTVWLARDLSYLQNVRN